MTYRTRGSEKKNKTKERALLLAGLLACLGRRPLIPAARGGLMLAAADWAEFVPVRSGGLKLFFSFILFRI
jgi:hypothetical protein